MFVKEVFKSSYTVNLKELIDRFLNFESLNVNLHHKN